MQARWHMLQSDQTEPSPPRYSLSRMWRLTVLGIVKMQEENVSQWIQKYLYNQYLHQRHRPGQCAGVPQPLTRRLSVSHPDVWCRQHLSSFFPEEIWPPFNLKLNPVNVSWFPSHQSSRARSPETLTPVLPPSVATSKLHGGTWTRTPCGARATQRQGVSSPWEGRGCPILV